MKIFCDMFWKSSKNFANIFTIFLGFNRIILKTSDSLNQNTGYVTDLILKSCILKKHTIKF
jgi:hypothetical protein